MKAMLHETVRIKVQGGGENYVHGGISLRKWLCLSSFIKGCGQAKIILSTESWASLISESRKVSNLMFFLDFLQKQPVGEKVQPCNYSLYFTNDEGVPSATSKQL